MPEQAAGKGKMGDYGYGGGYLLLALERREQCGDHVRVGDGQGLRSGWGGPGRACCVGLDLGLGKSRGCLKFKLEAVALRLKKEKS